MDTENNSFVIKKVTAANFDDFLSLVTALAQYEKLSPPDEAARDRLWRDSLGANPKYHAFIGEIGGKSVAYIIYFFTYSSFLALPTLYVEDIFVLDDTTGKV